LSFKATRQKYPGRRFQELSAAREVAADPPDRT
jgi:hypothetical protein